MDDQVIGKQSSHEIYSYPSNYNNDTINLKNGNILKREAVLPHGQISVIDLEGTISNDECDFIVDNIQKHKILNNEMAEKKGSNVTCHGIGLAQLKRYDVGAAEKVSEILYRALNIVKRQFEGVVQTKSFSEINLREIFAPTLCHCDAPTNKLDDRVLSVIIALNDDYKGGVIHFPEQKFSCKLRKLQMIAFPPFWTHPHYVTKPLDGTVRYTVNTWLTFEERGSPYEDLLLNNTKTFL